MDFLILEDLKIRIAAMPINAIIINDLLALTFFAIASLKNKFEENIS